MIIVHFYNLPVYQHNFEGDSSLAGSILSSNETDAFWESSSVVFVSSYIESETKLNFRKIFKFPTYLQFYLTIIYLYE